MSYLFLCWTALLGLLSPIMCLTSMKKYILFSIVLFVVVSPVIFGFMDSTNLLIGGRLWSVLDIQFVLLIIIAYPLSAGETRFRQRTYLDTAVLIMTVFMIINIILGILRLGTLSGVLNMTRNYMTIPIYFVAVRILADPNNVKIFYKWVMYFSLFVVAFHVAVAFKLYSPPLYDALFETMESAIRYRGLLRSSRFLYEPFYIVSVSVALCHLFYSRSHRVLSITVLISSGFAILLTQARGMYGAAFIVALGVMVMIKMKVRLALVAVICMAGLFLVYQIASGSGVDLLYRFRGHGLERQGYSDTVRGGEFVSMINGFRNSPWAFLTGQGLGISHEGRGAANPRSFFHNDYFGALWNLGFIGFFCYCFVMFSCIFRGRQFCREPDLALLIMPARLIFLALAAYAVLNQTFWIYKGTALLMTIIAVSGNSSFYAEQYYAAQELPLPREDEIYDSDEEICVAT